MRFRFEIILIGILMTNSICEGFHHQRRKSNFHDLLRGLELSSDNRIFYEKRVHTSGDCIDDIIEGYQWKGDEIMLMQDVEGTQYCMNQCFTNVKCMGWSYDTESKNCWGLNNIIGVKESSSARSGSCVGTNIKAKCTESEVAQYTGHYATTYYTQMTQEECMAKCDQLDTCYGWFHLSGSCDLLSTVTQKITQDWGITGTCFAPQNRVPKEDPLKQFRAESLKSHNLCRVSACTPLITLDDDLNRKAQQFADQFAAADEIPPKYDKSKMMTVYWASGYGFVNGGVSVDNLCNEWKFYNFADPNPTTAINFPKIVWKSTTKMGVGRAYTSDFGSTFIVTVYDSTDDITKSFRENVPKKPCTVDLKALNSVLGI